MLNKTTLVIGASENADRYSNMAVKLLLQHKIKVYAIGNREGKIEDVNIHKSKFDYTDVDTITLYINPLLQKAYYDYFLSLKPNRIIFNPGTENNELIELAKKHNISAIVACTLVLLKTGQY